MDKQEREKLRENIVTKIAKTEKKVAELEELCQPISPENSIGRISRMDAINNKSVAEAALRTTKRKLDMLKAALSKINHPDFGTCISCKQSISPARLMYMPESNKCVRCAR